MHMELSTIKEKNLVSRYYSVFARFSLW